MQMKKREFAVIVILALLAAASFSANADIYLGTVEGYVKNITGGLVSGASVSAAVQSCSSGCSGSATSDSGGYYVIANLNLPAFGSVSVSATKASAAGSASTIADAFQAAITNVTICAPPSTPSLTAEPDTHSQSATLAWTSGAGAVYDEFKLDSEVALPKTSPQTRTGLSFATHTWNVRSCNNYCCSAWQSDSFDVYNNAPSAPTLQAEPDTNGTTVELAWSSGTDADGDGTYDQYQFNSGAIINATSPVNETNLTVGSYAWRVRTCDDFDSCSSWVEGTFLATGCAAASCPPCGGGGGRCPSCPPCEPVPCLPVVCEGSYKLVITVPPELKPGGHFDLNVAFESSIDLGKVKFVVESQPGITIPPQNFNSVAAKDEINFAMKGVVAASVEPRDYEATMSVYVDNALTIAQKFTISVVSGALVEMPAELPSENNLDLIGSVRKKLAKGDRLPFLINGQAHSLFVAGILDNAVQISIYSEPINLLIHVGETKDVEVTGGGIADLSIRLNSIDDSTADITISKIKPFPAKELLLISAGVFLTLLVIVLIVIYRLHAREKAKKLFAQIRAIERGK